MEIKSQKQQNSSSQQGQSQIAVPYTPPPPPDESSQKKFRSPLVNGALFAVIILLGGFMTYNYMGHQLTHLSAASVEVSPSPVPSITPTPTALP